MPAHASACSIRLIVFNRATVLESRISLTGCGPQPSLSIFALLVQVLPHIRQQLPWHSWPRSLPLSAPAAGLLWPQPIPPQHQSCLTCYAHCHIASRCIHTFALQECLQEGHAQTQRQAPARLHDSQLST